MEKEELKKPRISLENYVSFPFGITHHDLIKALSPEKFEIFIHEWLYGQSKKQYEKFDRIGGTGDKGRDIICYYENNKCDYYQCKHYKNSLTPSDIYVELGKLCHYTFKKEIQIPEKYYLIASNEIGPTLYDLIRSPEKLKNELINNWKNKCEKKITTSSHIYLEGEFYDYVKNFDFSIVTSYSLDTIILEHRETIYGKIRFGQENITIEQIEYTENIQSEELPYINELLNVYSEKENIKLKKIEDLKNFPKHKEHLNSQRINYFSVKSIQRFVRDTLIDEKDFDTLKNEVYLGIVDVYNKEGYKTGYDRLTEVLIQATLISTGKSLLDKKLNCVGNGEKKGVCHLLVNDNKLKWVKDNGSI